MKSRVWMSIVIVILGFASSRAAACLNDSEIQNGENEFRSRYDLKTANDTAPPKVEAFTMAINPWGVAALAAGSGLVAGSVIAAFFRRRSQS